MDRDVAQMLLTAINSVKTIVETIATNTEPTSPAASLSISPVTLGDTRAIEDMPDVIPEEPEAIQEKPKSKK